MHSPHFHTATSLVCAGLALFLAVRSSDVNAQPGATSVAHAVVAVSRGPALQLLQQPATGIAPHPNRMVCRHVVSWVGVAIGVDCVRSS